MYKVFLASVLYGILKPKNSDFYFNFITSDHLVVGFGLL